MHSAVVGGSGDDSAIVSCSRVDSGVVSVRGMLRGAVGVGGLGGRTLGGLSRGAVGGLGRGALSGVAGGALGGSEGDGRRMGGRGGEEILLTTGLEASDDLLLAAVVDLGGVVARADACNVGVSWLQKSGGDGRKD